MRHRKKKIRLGRTTPHRKAALKNMTRALLLCQSIKTTRVKAKETRILADNVISIAKKNTPYHQRLAFSIIPDKKLIKELFKEIAPRFKNRNGGYTRVIPLSFRRGDGADMVILELTEKKVVEKPKIKAKKEPAKGKKILPKKEQAAKPEEKAPERMVAPKPKAVMTEEIAREKAKTEEKKQKGFLKGIKKMFRRKSF